jgi:DNA-directed RNA polymerase subunit RPC12/RpoP
MDDYIKRSDAIKTVCGDCEYYSTNDCEDCRLDRITKIPPADVRPVKEGHWVKARGNWCAPGGDPVWECSECGKGVHVYGIEHGTYGSDIADDQWVSCPNCGASMGGTP